MPTANLMRKSTYGFSLLELMVVLAIMGILTVLAIPMYQNYLIRGRLAEVLNLMSGFQPVVVENLIANNGAGPGTCQGISAMSNLTDNMSSLSCDDETGTLSGKSTARAGDVTLYLTPTYQQSGLTSWKCSSDAKSKAPLYLPGACRN